MEKHLSLKLQGKIRKITASDSIIIENTYFKSLLHGSHPEVFARASVIERIEKVAKKLEAHSAGLIVFDAFRSTETQRSLFKLIYKHVQFENPKKTDDEIYKIARRFAADPDDKIRRAEDVPPHNTGGAIDLAIFDLKSKKTWDFGSDFDDPNGISATHFFDKEFNPIYEISEERWIRCQKNRAILFQLMQEQGFVNYEHEWWHYSLGDRIWARKNKTQPIYSSIEDEVQKLISDSQQSRNIGSISL